MANQVRDKTNFALLYGAQIAAGAVPNHEFCEHGCCKHCGADAEMWEIACDRSDTRWPRHKSCEYCEEEKTRE